MCQQCAQENSVKTKLESERDQENLIIYVEDYYELTPTYELKEISKLHHDFNKQKSNRQKLIMKILSALLSLRTAMV